MYMSYFTSMVTPEVKVEWSSDLRAEQSSEREAEQSSNSKSGVEQSSDLEVEWNLEQWKCEMGHPLTKLGIGKSKTVPMNDHFKILTP